MSGLRAAVLVLASVLGAALCLAGTVPPPAQQARAEAASAPAAVTAQNPQADPLAAEGDELAVWVRNASDHPDAMLALIQRRWPADLEPDSPRQRMWLLARAQALLADGQSEAAEAIATELSQRPKGVDHAWLIRALLQDRQNRPSGALAARAMSGFDKLCPRGDEIRAVAAGCPYRAAWQALILIEHDQSSQGATAAAESTLRYALALAKAAGDNYLVAVTLSRLALVLQAQEHPDAAWEAMRSALLASQSDPKAGARVRSAEGVMAQRAGDIVGARLAVESALSLADADRALHFAAQLRTNLLDVYIQQGELKRALEVGQAALPVLLQYKDRPFERLLRHNLAIALIKLRQFDMARRELARADELQAESTELVPRARALRELGDAWAEAGQFKEALAAIRSERDINGRANERSREAALEELRQKYDSGSKQRDLDLLERDNALKDQQLANRKLAQQVSLALGVLLLLSVALAGVTLVRMRRAQLGLKASQALLRNQSERDPLTNLSNRRHFLSVMEQRGGDDFRGALLMIDIDHFKNVNDQHGHAAGDAVIVEVGRRISQAVRASDLVARWGGEEFLVFCPELDHADLAQLAERILQGIGHEPIATDEGPLRITASLGFASFPLGSGFRLHWEQAVNWADMVLYKAKAEGRNRAVGILGVRPAGAEGLGQILQDFDAACQRGEVRLTTLLGPE